MFRYKPASILILLAALCLAGASAAGYAGAASLGVPGTVSVASLRVSPTARDHYEKARRAVLAHHDEVYQREIAKALAIAPDFAEAHLLVADQQLASGQYEAAIAHALEAARLDPQTPWAAILIASCYNGEKRYADAVLLLGNLPREGAESWQAKYELARAEIGRGHVEEALHWSRLALDAAPPGFADAHLTLANALQMAQRWDEARAQLELYLASPGPLLHRAPVEIALRHLRLRAAQMEQGSVAAE